jgi:hypothetical protein
VRTVRDEPRGLSDLLPRTVRADVEDRSALSADRPLNTHRTPEATRGKRTVRQGRADRPRHPRTVRYLSADRPQTGCNQNQKPNRIESKDAKEHDEHATNRLLADRPRPPPRTVRAARTEQKQPDPESQLPQIIIGFPKRLKLWTQGFGNLKSVTQGCYSPKILPPNSLNHRESRIL